MKYFVISLITLGLFVIVGLSFIGESTKSFAGISSNTCTASSTVWTIGPAGNGVGTKAVLPARGNRLFFILHQLGVNTTAHYRLDATTPTVLNSIMLAASTSVTYSEDLPYRGVITANAIATTSLLVTECLY